MPRSRGAGATLLALISLAVALAVLATLQYRWIGRLAEADARRMRASLEFAANRFVTEFDHDLLTRTYLAFGEPNPLGSPRALVERYHSWASSTRDPNVIREIYFVPAGSTDLQRLDLSRNTFVPAQWPAGLSTVRARLSTMDRAQMERIPPIVPQSLALVVPCGSAPVILRPDQLAEMLHRHLPMVCPTFTIIELDRQRLLQVVFPDLTRRYFGATNGGEYEVAVADGDSGEVLYRSDRWPENGDARADFDTAIFRLRMPRFGEAGILPGMQTPGSWRLLVRYRDSSLPELVAAARRRNLAVALAILAVLGGSAATLMIMLRRAQRLQQQQLEFVAGITHELNTPLAAVTAAGQNLADGIILDRDEVSRYGSIILKESRRLTDMVAQVLDYAGMQARAPRPPREVDLGAAISDAVEQCRWMIAEKPLRIEVSVAPNLPSVRGDASALTRAIQNLVANAIRHGGDGGWVRVSAARSGTSLAVTVEDGGRGIRAADLPHLFEPFFRGDAAARVRGSGLGLTIVRQIVEALGGSVTVDRQRERGASFTIVLPAEPPAAAVQEIASEHA